jgi:hypothetical protein
MKTYSTLFLILALCAVKIYAQTKVDHFPAWFFEPGADEYVGISFPAKNKDAAKQQAITGALLSFMIQHELTGYFSSPGTLVSQNGAIFNSDNLSRLEVDMNIEYTVADVAENSYGECFVKIKALLSNNPKDKISINYRFNEISERMYNNEEHKFNYIHADDLLIQTNSFRGRISVFETINSVQTPNILPEQSDSIGVEFGFKHADKSSADNWNWKQKESNSANHYTTLLPAHTSNWNFVGSGKSRQIDSCLGAAFWLSLLNDWLCCTDFWEKDTGKIKLQTEENLPAADVWRTRKATLVGFTIKDEFLITQQFK